MDCCSKLKFICVPSWEFVRKRESRRSLLSSSEDTWCFFSMSRALGGLRWAQIFGGLWWRRHSLVWSFLFLTLGSQTVKNKTQLFSSPCHFCPLSLQQYRKSGLSLTLSGPPWVRTNWVRNEQQQVGGRMPGLENPLIRPIFLTWAHYHILSYWGAVIRRCILG